MENKQFPEEEFLTPEPEGIPSTDAVIAEIEEILAEEPVSTPMSDATQIFEPIKISTEESPSEDLFHIPALDEEITVDHHAISDHDLVHHEDAEFLFDNNYSDAPTPDNSTPTEQWDDTFTPVESYSDIPATPQPRPLRKGRPKRKKGYGFFGIPHLLATAVWLVIIVSIGVSLGRMLWVCAADVLAFGRPDKAVTVTINKQDTIDDIADKLHEAGLVRYPGLFKLYADLAVDEGEIASGTFELNTLYDYHALVNGMSAYSSFRTVIENVVIPEGYNCRQIFALLEEKGVCTVEELEEYAANGEFKDFWFLEGLERGDKYCLEGFLFPDTYEFYANSTPREALGKMLLGFESRFTEELQAQLVPLNERLSAMMRASGCSDAHIADNQLDMYDLVIVASLIEEETANNNESPIIASVIYNRLTENNEYERYLGIDATILYALGEHKDDLTAEDLAIDSPYNTRTHAGLVPTPISNPGLDSLKAALEFADTDYYYYVLNPETGNHQFSKTLEEHEKWREKFAGGAVG